MKKKFLATCIIVLFATLSMMALTDYSPTGWDVTIGNLTIHHVSTHWERGVAKNVTKDADGYHWECLGRTGTCVEINGNNLTINEGAVQPGDTTAVRYYYARPSLPISPNPEY